MWKLKETIVTYFEVLILVIFREWEGPLKALATTGCLWANFYPGTLGVTSTCLSVYHTRWPCSLIRSCVICTMKSLACRHVTKIAIYRTLMIKFSVPIWSRFPWVQQEYHVEWFFKRFIFGCGRQTHAVNCGLENKWREGRNWGAPRNMSAHFGQFVAVRVSFMEDKISRTRSVASK